MYLTAGALLDGCGGNPLIDPVVVIEGNRIIDIDSGPLPEELEGEIIDLGTRTLMPGMIDVHLHLFGVRGYSPAEYVINPHDFRVLRVAEDCAKLLNAGFTFVRDCGSTIALSAARAVREGVIPGPDIYASGKIITQTGGHGDSHYLPVQTVRDDPNSLARLADGPDECVKATREMIRLGADFIKIATSGGVGSEKTHPLDERFTVEEVRAICDEAHRAGRRVASHAQGAPGVKNALRGGVDTIEHGYFIDEECISMMLERGTYFVPTLALIEVFKASVQNPLDMPPWRLRKQRECIDAMETSFRRAYEAGITMCTGPDYFGAPMRAHGDNADEPITMVKYGMSPRDAICAATKNGAECLGIEGDYGTVEIGKVADIVGIHGNPLEDISLLKSGISFVMKNGRVHRI